MALIIEDIVPCLVNIATPTRFLIFADSSHFFLSDGGPIFTASSGCVVFQRLVSFALLSGRTCTNNIQR